MLLESSILEEDYIFLVQTNNKNLEYLLSNSIDEDKNIRLESVTSSENLREQLPRERIITFIIGSDVQDPIQSAQRFHAFKRNAEIILLARSENVESLKEAVKFSPFIGMGVFCLDESREEELEVKLDEILRNSQRAEKYRDIIAESNAKISAKPSVQESAVDQNFINKLMDIAPIGITIVGRQGNVLGWNKEATSIFNKNEAQVLGMPLSQLFGRPEGTKLEDYLRQSFEKSKADPIDPLSLERKSKDMTRQTLSITAAPFTYSEGTQKALILAIKDITQNIALLDQLKTAVTARDNFLSMASHELRTPLTSIRINLELLRRTIKQNFPDASDSLKFSDKSLKLSGQLNGLIEDLFDIAKIRSGKLGFRLEKFNLSKFVKEYVMETEEKFKKANSELELDIEPNVVGVWDKDRIGQAFANLVTNALKYAPDAPIKITLKTTGNWAYLSVQDQGPGISKDQQEKIFDRFERVTDSKTIAGLGLGLFITKKIVEGHAGKVQIQSSPGKGSTFTLKLPLKLDPEKQPEEPGILW